MQTLTVLAAAVAAAVLAAVATAALMSPEWGGRRSRHSASGPSAGQPDAVRARGGSPASSDFLGLATLDWAAARGPAEAAALGAKRAVPCLECARHTAVLCGLAHNVVSTLPAMLESMRKTGELFADYRVVVMESDSDDGSAALLAAWQQQDPGRVTVISRRMFGEGVRNRSDRTVALAAMRNMLASVIYGMGSVREGAGAGETPPRQAARWLTGSDAPRGGGRRLARAPYRHWAPPEDPEAAAVRLAEAARARNGCAGGLCWAGSNLTAQSGRALRGGRPRGGDEGGEGGPATWAAGARSLAGFSFDVVVMGDLDFEFGWDVGGVASVFRPHDEDAAAGWFGSTHSPVEDGECRPPRGAILSAAESDEQFAAEVASAGPRCPPPRPGNASWAYEWDVAAAYGQQAASGFVWDWAALRLRGLDYGNHIEARSGSKWYPALKRRLRAPGLPWMPVRCAFGGLAVFRAAALATGQWSGDSSANGCEHAGLCTSMAMHGFRRVFVVPTMVQLYDLRGGGGSWLGRLANASANTARSRPKGWAKGGGLRVQTGDSEFLSVPAGERVRIPVPPAVVPKASTKTPASEQASAGQP